MKSNRFRIGVVVSDLTDYTWVNPVGFAESLQAFVRGLTKFVYIFNTTKFPKTAFLTSSFVRITKSLFNMQRLAIRRIQVTRTKFFISSSNLVSFKICLLFLDKVNWTHAMDTM